MTDNPIPAREQWLHDNPEALAAVRQGLDEARRGEFAEAPDVAADLREFDDESSADPASLMAALDALAAIPGSDAGRAAVLAEMEDERREMEAEEELIEAHKLMDQSGVDRARGGSPLRLAQRIWHKHEQMQETIEAREDELAEARRLLAMATSFDAGPLLPDAPADWSCPPFSARNALDHVRIWSFNVGGNVRWMALYGQLDLAGYSLIDGEWVDVPNQAATWIPHGKSAVYDSPAAALAALDAWRAARRAEIAGQGGVAQPIDALDEMVRINQETGQYDDRPNPMIRGNHPLDQPSDPVSEMGLRAAFKFADDSRRDANRD